MRDVAPAKRPTTITAKQQAARARCDAMVHHARAQIRTSGVDRFNVNEVLRLSGGSKATLVKYFGDRTGLIAAAIRAEAETTLASLHLDSDESGNSSLADALRQMLLGVLRFYLTQGALALYRAVVSAAADNPAGAIAFYEQGHRVIVDALAALLEARKPTDVRHDLDCISVADMALHAIRAGLYEQALIGIDVSPDEGAMEARVNAVVAVLLPGLAPPQSP